MSVFQKLPSSLSFVAIVSLMTACSGTPDKPPVSKSDQYQLNRYSISQDRQPLDFPKPHEIKDATPRAEERKRAGNYSPYTVFGKTYRVMDDSRDFKQSGKASWYGLKFHGHKTSNGEIYSIYEMTAAHKTLPIPSYVQVTNLANNRSCIVRVNDRGPFHDGRIIDLSYAAATKLGYAGMGTTDVKIEVIDPDEWIAAQARQQQSQEKSSGGVTSAMEVYLQVGAYSQLNIATATYQRLYAEYNFPVILKTGQGSGDFHRIHIGPVAEADVASIQDKLVASGMPKPVRVRTAP
ncbi:Endolytic peptidoglycan transglycosylase RlpA [BD1-7 clade bacterium]|uniref:Endolytic peptidoglycan transglycosylase RlpA n=1 Tax=BD1-7 clade bacterium TaxID=2029982 RepID=A0A5S9PVY2_9GAMM|nr:Endolytic peptidoglycan transglycosylase RlpA [BD1-7 clade bacterium]CAA0108923.1 Endolytic peptidoglycan transglycosylase RlpA [BD1-7 clade bacterium]